MRSGTSKFMKVLKASLRLVVFVGLVRYFLIVDADDRIENGGGRIRVIYKGVGGIMKQGFVGRVLSSKHRVLLSNLELYYMSKRRVPNGPDPIHNRRAGNSHRPPGHV